MSTVAAHPKAVLVGLLSLPQAAALVRIAARPDADQLGAVLAELRSLDQRIHQSELELEQLQGAEADAERRALLLLAGG